MATEEFIEIERSISKVKRTSRIIQVICNVGTVLAIALWAVPFSLFLLGLQSAEAPNDLLSSVIAMVYTTVLFAWIIIFIRIVSRMASDTTKGEPPFSPIQVKRIRLMALMLLILAVLEFILSAGVAVAFEQLGIRVEVLGSTDFSGSVIKINGGAIFMSAVLFCLSVFFDYGSLLQQHEDETI